MWKWGISHIILGILLQIRHKFCGKVGVLKSVNYKKYLSGQYRLMFTNDKNTHLVNRRYCAKIKEHFYEI